MFAALVVRKQQELERELEKYSLRRLPLGYDRHHRRYWWNLASQRPLVFVEREDACLVALKTPEELDALMQSLDKRGLRELALYNALEKVASSSSCKEHTAPPTLPQAHT